MANRIAGSTIIVDTATGDDLIVGAKNFQFYQLNAISLDCQDATATMTVEVKTYSDTVNSLASLGGLTFSKDYKTESVDADFSIGDKTGTFTWDSTTSARTYVDGSGVIQSANTSNTPRFAGGYYDATGFHTARGLMIESASANLLVRTDGTASGSGIWTGWTNAGTRTGTPVNSQVSAPTLTSIASSYAQRVQYTGVAGDAPSKTLTLLSTNTAAGSIVQNDIVTGSVWVRSVTGNPGVTIKLSFNVYSAVPAYVSSYSGSDIAGSLTTTWRKFSYTPTITDATADRVNFGIVVGNIDDTENVDFEIYAPQVECASHSSPYPTSFIPTTSAAVTRNAETLKYVIAGNRTAATETIAIKFMPLGGSFANDGIQRCLLTNDAPERHMRKATTSTTMGFRPNFTDSAAAASTITGADPVAVNTSYVMGYTLVQATPTFQDYLNGSADGAATGTAWTLNNWASSTYFYLGSVNAAESATISRFDGLIQSVAIFSDAKSAANVATITGILNQ